MSLTTCDACGLKIAKRHADGCVPGDCAHLAPLTGAKRRHTLKMTELERELVEALRPFVDLMPSKDAPCHVGICSQEKCGRCSLIARGRAAIAKAES